MLVDVKVPVLAESIAEATLLKWQKQAGERVERGENLIDIETDKVTLEVSALNNGVLAEILKENGAIVESDEIIARIDTGAAVRPVPVAEVLDLDHAQAGRPDPREIDNFNEEARAAVRSAPEAAEAAPKTEDPRVAPAASEAPKTSPAVRNLLGEHGLEATDIATDSDRINKADVLAHIEARGATAAPRPEPAHDDPAPPTMAASDVPAPESEPATGGTTPETAAASGQAALRLEAGSDDLAPEPAPATPEPAPATPESAPAPAGRRSAEAAPVEIEDRAAQPLASARPEHRAPMTRLRKRAAERLLGAQRDNAILTTFNEVNMRAIMDIRQRYKEEFEATHEIKLGFMSFFTAATVAALKQFPIINASIEDDNIVYHGYFDIGIAVSSERGLVVPILRDADMLSLAELEAQIRAYGQKARDGKLTIEELTGGTFTITNGGIFGSLLSTPILNPPQSAILGMHAINQRPVAEHGEVVIRPMMYLALSYDHRIIDGRDAVQFLAQIKRQLEDPTRLLLRL